MALEKAVIKLSNQTVCMGKDAGKAHLIVMASTVNDASRNRDRAMMLRSLLGQKWKYRRTPAWASSEIMSARSHPRFKLERGLTKGTDLSAKLSRVVSILGSAFDDHTQQE